MAHFTVHGADKLMTDFKAAGNVPDSVKRSMLEAMAEKAREAMQNATSMLTGPFTTGRTKSAITAKEPKLSEDGGTADIVFAGSRKRGKRSERNAAIAYINEFGKKGQPARPFIKTALEKNGGKINDAGAKVFYAWLESKGL